MSPKFQGIPFKVSGILSPIVYELASLEGVRVGKLHVKDLKPYLVPALRGRTLPPQLRGASPEGQRRSEPGGYTVGGPAHPGRCWNCGRETHRYTNCPYVCDHPFCCGHAGTTRKNYPAAKMSTRKKVPTVARRD